MAQDPTQDNAPNAAPNEAPNAAPNEAPNAAPNEAPNAAPNEAPNAAPNAAPNDVPNAAPNDAPNNAPSIAPSDAKTQRGIILKDGTLSGRVSSKTNTGLIVPVDRLDMKLIHNGQIVETARSSASGEFEFIGIGPGNYSVAGVGKNGFLAVSVNILDERDAVDENDEFSVDVLAIPPRYTTLARILSRQMTVKNPRRLGFGQTALTRGLLASAPTGVTRKGAPSIRFAKVSSAMHARDDVIFIGQDGVLRGRAYAQEGLAVNYSGLKAFAIQSDQLVAETSLDENGVFELTGFKPGVFGFVIAGPEGFAAVQGEVKTRLDPQVKADGRQSEFRLTALQQPDALPIPADLAFELSLLSAEDLQALLDSLPPELRALIAAELGLPVGPDFLGMGTGGAGSGVANPDLLARLLGLGGLITGIIALATDRTSPD